MRHQCISLCRDTLSWLGKAADDLETECAELCERAAGLPERMEKRLSAVRAGRQWGCHVGRRSGIRRWS